MNMMNWSDGYVTDLSYLHLYTRELNPVRAHFMLTAAGIHSPVAGCQQACELGFGQGLSVTLHTAAGPAHWWGTDFNPHHAANARELGYVGNPAQLSNESFEEFCARGDLPDFDFIGLHGVYSWISRENQRRIEDLVRRRLRVGGVFYVSYATLPGWSALQPLRELMVSHASVAGSRDTATAIKDAFAFARALLETEPAFAKVNTAVNKWFADENTKPANYLAHEYFVEHGQPLYFTQMAKRMQRCKLDYACSATLADDIDEIQLTPAQQALIKQKENINLQQAMRDLMVNRSLRQDYWVRGSRRMNSHEHMDACRKLHVQLAVPRSLVSTQVRGAASGAEIMTGTAEPLLAILQDHKAHSIGDIERALASRDITMAQVWMAVRVLISNGSIEPVQVDAKAIDAACVRTRALNARLLERARYSSDIEFLASPVTGGACPVMRMHQLFLLARAQGKKTPEEWAAACWGLLSAQGQRVVKEGKELHGHAENLAEFVENAKRFASETLPVLKSLRIV